MLNEQQSDLLKECVNIFMGNAASMLSEMANQKILLRVPELKILDMAQDSAEALKKISLFSKGHIVSSVMNFGYDFSGKALLIFPAENAKSLVDACLGDIGEETISPNMLEDTDFDVLKEVSNVLLNSIIGEFANMLGVKLEFTLPDVELIFVSEFEQKMYLKNNNVYILMLYTVFTLAETKVDGVVVIALGMDSLNMLIAKLDEVLGEANG